MHGDDCQYGADICVTWRGHSWLGERGVRLARTGPGQDPVLTLPARQAAPARVDPGRPAMTGPTLRERLRDVDRSTWELGDLLGIHPHLVSDSHGQPLTARPVQPLIEIARRLDLHPADPVPELEPLLSRRRQASGDDLDQDLRADALTVLAALATARAPLSADQLARALGWPLPRTAAAIAAAQDDPGLGGPLALRRIPTGNLDRHAPARHPYPGAAPRSARWSPVPPTSMTDNGNRWPPLANGCRAGQRGNTERPRWAAALLARSW
jgi:hypothetical protein